MKRPSGTYEVPTSLESIPSMCCSGVLAISHLPTPLTVYHQHIKYWWFNFKWIISMAMMLLLINTRFNRLHHDRHFFIWYPKYPKTFLILLCWHYYLKLHYNATNKYNILKNYQAYQLKSCNVSLPPQLALWLREYGKPIIWVHNYMHQAVQATTKVGYNSNKQNNPRDQHFM